VASDGTDPAEPDQPVDPLADAAPRRIRPIARRADRLRRSRPQGLEALAADLGVPVRRLRLLADAWAEGGAHGLEAIGPALPTPPEPMLDAEAAVAAWQARHHPFESLTVEVWRNRLTVIRHVPAPDRRSVEDRPLLQLRLSSAGRWHLYRRAAHGEWWPVVARGPRRPQGVGDCLAAVEHDSGGRFWRDAEPDDARG
jgi:hypothetical protein